jgi:hypothetical protein
MKRPRNARALALAALVLAGCPIPQTVPEYPKGTSITPPRIVAETAVPSTDGAIIRVPSGCAVGPLIDMTAALVDENTTETVESRWFINYDKVDSSRFVPVQPPDRIQPPQQGDPNQPATTRQIPPYVYEPYDWLAPLGSLQVVELVVSNGFPPPSQELAQPLPYRTPLPGFETQVYRWVFLLTNDPCPP